MFVLVCLPTLKKNVMCYLHIYVMKKKMDKGVMKTPKRCCLLSLVFAVVCLIKPLSISKSTTCLKYNKNKAKYGDLF